MRALSSWAGGAVLWGLFFFSSVYGHAALKLAVDSRRSLTSAALSGWGLSAYAAWALSGVLWMAVLKDRSLFEANTLSALRYVLLCLAGVALFRAPIGGRELLGMGLVTGGVLLVAR